MSRSTILQSIVTFFSTADRTLAARIEHAEAANAEQMAALATESSKAAWIRVGGGIALFAGVGSPMTHGMGMGMWAPISKEEFDRFEDFYRERGSSALIDLCPMAHESLISLLQERHYHVVEFNNVLIRSMPNDERFETQSCIQPAEDADRNTWARTVIEGFSESMPTLNEQVYFMTEISARLRCVLAVLEGKPVGGAALAIQDQTALFIGDATLSGARRQGWQSRLIRERLRIAREEGCDLASVSVLPGSASHRNYERAGFELFYMRVNLAREFTSH